MDIDEVIMLPISIRDLIAIGLLINNEVDDSLAQDPPDKEVVHYMRILMDKLMGARMANGMTLSEVAESIEGELQARKEKVEQNKTQ